MKLLSTVLSTAIALSSLTVNADNGSNSYSVSVADLAPANISSDAIVTSLKTKNNTVPFGTKTYVASIRSRAERRTFCAGALISPKHVLTEGDCIGQNVRYASVGAHYYNGTQDGGEQIKVVSIMNHPNMSGDIRYAYDFTILELERPSSFKPIKLAAADGSDIKVGEVATKLGWFNVNGEERYATELQRSDVTLISNEECSKQTSVHETVMCSAPVADRGACTGDLGDPLIVERPDGDILIGSGTWGMDCQRPGYPTTTRAYQAVWTGSSLLSRASAKGNYSQRNVG